MDSAVERAAAPGKFRRNAHKPIPIAAIGRWAVNKDHAARDFYMACAEWLEFPADSRTLFLPIETLAAGFV